MTELQLITKAIDRLKMADDDLMKYNTDWSTDEKYKTILNLISTAYQCLMELEKIKVSSHESNQQSANSGQLQQHSVMESLPPPQTIFWPCLNCSKDTSETRWLCCCSQECCKEYMDKHKQLSSGNAP